MRRVAASCTFLLMLTGLVFALNETASERLLRTKSLKCEFGPGRTAEWQEGKLKLQDGVMHSDPAKATIHFDSINVQTRTARMIGNAGSTDLAVIATAVGITFIEQPPLGGIVVTTVFADYDSSKSFPVVMSKHVDLLGPFPQQYYGACKAWE